MDICMSGRRNQTNQHCAFWYYGIGNTADKHAVLFSELSHDQLAKLRAALCQYWCNRAFSRKYIIPYVDEALAEFVCVSPQLLSPFGMLANQLQPFSGRLHNRHRN